MSFDQYKTKVGHSHGATTEINVGLQKFMHKIYHTMGYGLAVTGLTAFAVANIPVLFNAIFGTPLAWVAIFAPLAFLWFGFTPAKVEKFSSEKLTTTFIIFSGIMGISMAALFHVFTGASIARVFFITAATFAATSLYGYTTKKDLTGVGSFMFMGLIGIIIASVVNMFMQSSAIHFIISVVGVLVFTGLTAWETQKLRVSYRDDNDEANNKMAVLGALSLYLNFINLFQMLLHLMGDRR